MYKETQTKCAAVQKYSLKLHPTWVLNSYWVVQSYGDPGTRHNNCSLLTIDIVEKVVLSRSAKVAPVHHDKCEKAQKMSS